jgi:acyl-CoA reductase-like NAD-dependent aldehyde dehydrogenase
MQHPLEVRIAGRPVVTDRTLEVTDPYTGETVGKVPICGADEVDAACRVAQAALERDDFPQFERATVLERAAGLLQEQLEDFAQLQCAEAGKPIRDARKEVSRCVETLRFSAVEARKLGGEVLPAAASAFGQDRVMFTVRVPIGVVAAITPFNFPLNLVAHKLGPAIAAGCPVVLKPAPQAPLSAIALVSLLVEAGLPADWISTVTDAGSEAGGPLVRHPIPRMVTFTGSAAVGWSIAELAARKRVALELGGAAPLIVEPGVDLEEVAAKAAAGGFGYAGQSCISVQRILVHRDVHADLRDALAARARELVPGDPRDERTDLGPLIEERHTRRVHEWIQEAASGGGTVVTGGQPEGRLLPPTVVDTPPVDSRLWREEVFGPVVSLRPYDDFADAIALANDSRWAIHAGVYTNDLAKVMRSIRQLQFAGININDIPTFRLDLAPYGGVRDSGNTREGPASTVEEMTEVRTVSLLAG